MPDWSYRTIFRPLLFRLPARTARDLTLGVMGTLARMPWGSLVIDFLGHMRPDERLSRSLLGIQFPTPVGLACDLDNNAVALPALAQFGVGFIEVGPLFATGTAWAVERRPSEQALWLGSPEWRPDVSPIWQRLRRAGRLPVPLLVRLGDPATADCCTVATQLAACADAFVIGPTIGEEFRQVVNGVRGVAPDRPLLLSLFPNLDHVNQAIVDVLVETALTLDVRGVIVDAAVAERGGTFNGLPLLPLVLQTVRRLRQRWGDRLTIIAGGVHEPEQALQLRDAGADLVQVSTGLMYSGPGLPKRINDAWLYAEHGRDEPPPLGRAVEMTWFWTLLMGLGMLGGGLLALAIAATRVVLHYDEVFSGMSRDQLAQINPRLLAFMAHDRVSLAGTMVTIGILYPLLSWFGIRQGLHWAKVAVLASAFAGFASFFLFIGFGYFDPFHAFVTAILFQFLLLAVHGKLAKPQATPANLREDWRWRLGQWAQLLFIVHNFTLIGGGCFIAFIGTTHVFVHEDLEFMQTTAEALTAANPRLVPLVAHDRASFGGMLIASGIGLLLPSLWGFRQGSRWLWWTFLLSAVPAYLAGIGVHFAVGYTNLLHLTPAIGGATMFTIALTLAWPYMCSKPSSP
jgi:dihydroorotate dehydrogenase